MTVFATDRYERMKYNRCGRSGLQLPAISLGCWWNFTELESSAAMLRRAFDLGITHFDLANNYGPPPGRAEEIVGRVLHADFAAHRDELIISSKAGHLMWPGPYGDWGSKKYLVASLDQSLRRLKLDYVDIFYSHRFDPKTPLEETLSALELIVRQGKALYAGISSYDEAPTCEAVKIMQSSGVPITIHQPSYSLLNRKIEKGLLGQCRRLGVGVIAFCPLAQGLLTDKYLNGLPTDSRAKTLNPKLAERLTPEMLTRLNRLNALAKERGETLAQMALAWVLRNEAVTGALIGASKPTQIEENAAAVNSPPFSAEELKKIDEISA
jgi:L-glyceraldehyde 3-phosphate reductase